MLLTGVVAASSNRVDKAPPWQGGEERGCPILSPSPALSFETASGGASSLRQRFENMAKSAEEENKKRAVEEKARGQAWDPQRHQAALEQQTVRSLGAGGTQHLACSSLDTSPQCSSQFVRCNWSTLCRSRTF